MVTSLTFRSQGLIDACRLLVGWKFMKTSHWAFIQGSRNLKKIARCYKFSIIKVTPTNVLMHVWEIANGILLFTGISAKRCISKASSDSYESLEPCRVNYSLFFWAILHIMRMDSSNKICFVQCKHERKKKIRCNRQ